ncbi:metallophosphoesterase [Halapricum hydrolyticum]|uniref:Metallophosphoesterase n=1 Tax=Halapricum hydrolyticum TaxID=2979991 RepID=A0AAE3IBW6_9EURY|nr:metallophosphoesterase [Halapricum hydrolyticum]MCU4717956.1 metallophosphoesterase [Halapricum hydrolyticum]MCU4727121.1 metallophosphoesterase [Halapricum hydrolyticum]
MTVTFRDRAVLMDGTLVLADLHFGRAATSAVEAPIEDGQDVLGRLEELLEATAPRTVVLAGDVLHAFDTIPSMVDDRLAALEERVIDADAELVVVAGNHDTMLGEVWDGPIADRYRIDERTVVVHGHERPDVEAERYVLGHDHPVIEIEGQRQPCFLQGPGGPDGAEALVLPAFNRFTAGVPINGMDATDFQSPLVVAAEPLEPIVRDEHAGETLRFPQLGSFRHYL